MSERESHDLSELLARAARASPSNRIELRDPIAAFGTSAVDAVEPWVADPRLGTFAVRVLEVVAAGADRAAAVAALARARPHAGSPAIGRDIDQRLARFGSPAPSAAKPPTDPFAVYPLPAAAGHGWPGFQEHEFGQIAGTSWRGRDGAMSLAPILTRALRYQHPHFESYAIERLPELHFAIAERYRLHGEHESGFRAAKLFVYAHGPTDEHPTMPRQVAAGLYVEKGNGSEPFGQLSDEWDWPHLVAALGDPHVQSELGAAMLRHGLRLGDYRVEAEGQSETAIGAIARMEDGVLVARDDDGEIVGTGWASLQSQLANLPRGVWHECHVWRTWRADEAIASGQTFASEALLPVLSDLARVYLDVVGPLLPSWARSS
jgi:hypothetical protein